jgi:hypothetical protein
MSDPEWKTIAVDALDALRSINAHYDDLSKSNPGFMGKMCLQDYGLWNESLLKSEKVLKRYLHLLKKKSR